MPSLLHLSRSPLPLPDLATAALNASRICAPRGHCGPFLNEEYYNAFPEELWHGMGDCSVCGSTCHVPTEDAKRSRPRAA